MGDLVPRMHGSIAQVREELERAHAEVAIEAMVIARRFADLPPEGWGIAAKRVTSLPSGQPFAELANQLATMERLIDALLWVEAQAPNATAVAANPTTTSDGPDLRVDFEHAEPTWIFEVSDVAAAKNNNGKLDRDLRSLGLTPTSIAIEARRFLVVSEEWMRWLRAQKPTFWTRRGCAPPSVDDLHDNVGHHATGVIELQPVS